jgi:hypothetical protein
MGVIRYIFPDAVLFKYQAHSKPQGNTIDGV